MSAKHPRALEGSRECPGGGHGACRHSRQFLAQDFQVRPVTVAGALKRGDLAFFRVEFEVELLPELGLASGDSIPHHLPNRLFELVVEGDHGFVSPGD